jgi:hypothetical protein
MKIYQCKKCLKEFTKKCHLDDHLEKRKTPCQQLIKIRSHSVTKSEKFGHIRQQILVAEKNQRDDDYKNVLIKDDPYECSFCYKKYSRHDSLMRHINSNCKVKNAQEQKINKLEEEIILLKDIVIKNNNTAPNHNNDSLNTNHTQSHNTHSLNTTNSNNTTNNVQVNICAFGKEDLDKLDISEAMKVYLKSTGGNIIPNMLKYINLNEKYPENHNIYITDNSRELVKMNNGKNTTLKKFKNAKYEIVSNVSNNINGIVDKYKESNYKKSKDIEDKININNLSLKVINGEELCVSDSESNDSSSTEDEDKKRLKKAEKYKKYLKKEELRKRYEHINSKMDGLQKITYDKLKEELYNGKILYI